MAKTLADLSKRVRKVSNKLEETASDVAKRTALIIVDDLAHITPVDTSNALSNWQVKLASPVTRERAAFFEGIFGSTHGSSALATVATAKRVLVDKKPRQSIFISNLAPYIKELNEGSSRQAPAGFVDRTVLVAKKSIKRLGTRKVI